MGSWLVVVALAAALMLGGCPAHGVGTRTRTVAETPTHKRLTVYSSSTFNTEAREVSVEVVAQALQASSMFFEEDIRFLAPKISPELATLEEDERLVVETADTAIHVFVGNNEIQVVNFRQGHEMSRHSSAIPAAAVKTELTQKAPAPPTPVPAQVTVTVDPRPPVVVTAPPSVVVPPEPTPRPVVVKPKPTPPKVVAKPTGPRLTESEIRTRLGELDRLRAKDLITEPEYQQKRKALLDQL